MELKQADLPRHQLDVKSFTPLREQQRASALGRLPGDKQEEEFRAGLLSGSSRRQNEFARVYGRDGKLAGGSADGDAIVPLEKRWALSRLANQIQKIASFSNEQYRVAQVKSPGSSSNVSRTETALADEGVQIQTARMLDTISESAAATYGDAKSLKEAVQQGFDGARSDFGGWLTNMSLRAKKQVIERIDQLYGNAPNVATVA